MRAELYSLVIGKQNVATTAALGAVAAWCMSHADEPCQPCSRALTKARVQVDYLASQWLVADRGAHSSIIEERDASQSSAMKQPQTKVHRYTPAFGLPRQSARMTYSEVVFREMGLVLGPSVTMYVSRQQALAWCAW
jgi:hypothetical protein